MISQIMQLVEQRCAVFLGVLPVGRQNIATESPAAQAIYEEGADVKSKSRISCTISCFDLD